MILETNEPINIELILDCANLIVQVDSINYAVIQYTDSIDDIDIDTYNIKNLFFSRKFLFLSLNIPLF